MRIKSLAFLVCASLQIQACFLFPERVIADPTAEATPPTQQLDKLQPNSANTVDPEKSKTDATTLPGSEKIDRQQKTLLQRKSPLNSYTQSPTQDCESQLHSKSEQNCANAPPSVVDSIESEKTDSDDNTPKWKNKLDDGPEDLFYFVEAVSGKKLKDQTFNLLKGVTDIEISEDHIQFFRCDKQSLRVGGDTTGGAKFYEDWEKAKTNLQEKFGDQGKEFLDNIQGIHLAGNRIEVIRKGPEELNIDLGDKKLHPAFDLRSIRFKKIAVTVDNSSTFPKLRDINGVVAVIKAPGFSFPVEVKDFCKVRLEAENDITVGVTDPVPSAIRAFFFLPSIFHFHFRLKRKVN